MKMWITKTHIQKANVLETASEARGSDLIRLGGHLILQFVSALVTFNVDSNRWLFKFFENSCINEKGWS